MRPDSARTTRILLTVMVVLLALWHAPAPPTARAGEAIRVGSPTFGVDGQYFVWDASQFPISYTVDGGMLGTHSTASATMLFVDDMFDLWEALTTSSIAFTNIGAITSGSSMSCVTDGDVDTITEYNCLSVNFFPGNPMIFDADGSLTDAIIGVGASNSVLGFAGPVSNSGGFHFAGRAVLNGKFVDGMPISMTNPETTTANMQATALHEYGHFIGLGHSQINDDCLTMGCADGSDASFGLPTMYPVSFGLEEAAGVPAELTLSLDDIAWISMLYPASFNSTHGFISGTLFASDGLSTIQGGNVIARQVNDTMTAVDESLMCAVSAVSGERYTGNRGQSVTGDNPGSGSGTLDPAQFGTYLMPVPVVHTMGQGPAACAAAATAGMFTVEVESINASFTGGSSVGPNGRALGEVIPIPGPAEFHSGAGESNTDSATDVATQVSVSVMGTTSGVDIILDGTPNTNDPFEGVGRNDTVATFTPIGNGTTSANISPIMATGPDVDVYGFTAIAGQTVTFDINARTLPAMSFLDSVLEIVDSGGTRVSLCDTNGDTVFTDPCLNDDESPGILRDSILMFRSASAGTFFVRVLDWSGTARADFGYDVVVMGAGQAPPPPGCTKDFTGAVNMDWNDANNWNPSGVPGMSDNVCIGSTFTVNYSAGTSTIASLEDIDGTLNITAGSLTVTGGATVSGTLEVSGTGTLTVGGLLAVSSPLNVSGGTVIANGDANVFTLNLSSGILTVNSPGSFSVPNYTQSGGTLNGTGPLNLGAMATWSGGTQTGTGTTTINGALDISTGVTLDGRTMATGASGIANLSGAGNFNFANNPIFNNAGTFDIQSDASILPTTGTFNNSGTLRKSGGMGTSFIDATFNNPGTVDADSGTLDLGTLASCGVSCGGAFNVATGATLAFNGGTLNSTGSIAGMGNVQVLLGTVSVNGAYNVTGTTTVNGGTLNFNVTGTASTMNVVSGTLAGFGTITGNVSQTGGNINPGTSPGILNVTGNFTQAAAGVINIELGGTTPGNLATNHDQLNAGGTATVDGTFNITLFGGFMPAIGNSFTIATCGAGVNCGSGNPTLNFPAAPAGGVWMETSPPTNNMLVISVVAAAKTFDGGGDGTSWTDAMNWNPDGVPVSTDDVTIDAGMFAVTLSSGAQSVNSLTITGMANPFTLSGGSLTLASASSIAGAFNHSGGTLAGAGSLSIAGLFTWSSGTQDNVGTTNANGGLTLSTAGTKTLNNGRTLINAGMATWSDGEFFIGNGAVFTNSMTGTFDIQHTATRNLGGGVGGGSTVNNAGTMTKSAGGGLTVVNAGFNNSGTFNANDGTFRLISATNPSTSTGAFNVGAGSLEFNGGTYALNSGATVSGAGTTSVAGGTVNFNAGSSLTTAMLLSGGTLNLATGGTVTLPSLTQTGGTLAGTGIVDITGAFTWSSGTQDNVGTTNANGGMTLNTAGTKTLFNGRTLSNAGAGAWSDGEFFIGNGAVFTNAMTGTFDIQHAGTRNLGGGVGGGSTVNNAGTMIKSAGGGTTVVNAGFNNTGTLNANDGIFRLASAANPSTSTGAFNVGAGSLEFSNGTYDLNTPASVGGAGTTSFTGGTVNFNAGSSLTTAALLSGGTLNLATGGAVTLPTLTQTGGTLTGTGTVNITGAFTWSAGTQDGAGTTNANGGMTLGTSGTKTLFNGRTLSNAGAGTWSDGEFFIGNGAVFTNAMTGTFDIQHTGTRNLGGGVGGASTVNNAGMMTKSAGGGTTVVNAGFNNTGTLNANDGTFRLASAANPSTSTGAFNVGAGSLEFNTGTYDLNSGATVSGAGTTSVTGGTVNFNAGSSLTTAVILSSGILNLATGGTVTLPSLTQTGGTLSGAGVVDITGAFTWSSGTQDNVGTTNANGVLTLSSGGTKTLNNGRTLNNDGGATWSDGEVFIGNGAVFTNTINGLFDIQHVGTRNFGGGVGGVSTVNNDGTITKSAGAGSTVVNAAYNNNAGSVLNLNSGTMAFSTSFTQSGGSTTLNGGNLAGGITFNFNGGTLGGVGTITGNVNNAGAMLGPGLSAGTLNIMGNYIQGAAGALNTEIDGPAAGQFDVLNITGTAMLAGTLNVSSSTAFMPGAGSTFQIMTYASVSGDFATKNGLNLATPPFIGSPQSTFYLLTNVINADLAVTKTDTPDPVNVGGNVTYTVTITNNGPDPATGVTLTDTLPANSAFVSAMTTVGSCGAPVAGVLTCNIGNLANAASAVVTIIVTPNATAVPSITNTASATANENDPNAADNTNIMQTTTVNAVADLSVTKTDAPDPVTQGQNVTYTITVTNNGPSTATNVMLSDTLPAGTTFVSFTVPAGWTAMTPAVGGTGTVTATNPSVASAAVEMFTLVVSTNAAAVPSISNTATVSGAEVDPNAADNSASATTTVNPLTADLTVTKTDALDPVNVGDNVTYTITVTNNGPDPASNVSLTDIVPTGTTFVSFTAPAGWTAMTPAVGGTGTVTATNPSLATGTPQVFTLVVQTAAAAVPSISNTASVTAVENDPVPANNSATEATTVNPLIDLSVTKTDAPDPVLAGANIVYTVTVANAGPSNATNVSLTDTLPANTAFVSASPSQGTCPTLMAGVLTCNLGTINSGAMATMTLTVTTTAASVPSVTNMASVTAAETDTNAANDSDTEVTTVNPAADVAVTKTDSPDPVNVGANITYTITVTNNGPSPATNVSLSDMLPAGTTFVSLTAPAGWTLTTPAVGAGGTVTATNPALAAATPQTFTLVVAAGPTAVPSVSNTATVTAAEPDGNAANNSATATTTVNPLADLSITKTDSPDPVNNQSNITYTITVSNAGPSPAANVTVTDNVPAGTTFVSATPTQGTCPAPVGGVVTCNLGMMASGANVTITMIVTVTGFGPTVTNTATVASSVTDPVAANNSASTTTTVNVVIGNDFSITASPSIQNATPGSTATYTVTLTPIPAGSAFTNPIGLACFVQPPLSSCSFNPQTVTPGASPANSTLSVVVPTFAVAPPVGGPVNTAPPLTLWLLAMSLALVGTGVAGRRLARQNLALAPLGRRMGYCVTAGLVLLVLSMGMAQSACVTANHHITGPYTVTISGSAPGGLSHSTTVTVNVQQP